MNPKELEQALQDAFDGELDVVRAASLREVLKNSPAALDAYCDQALLEMTLRHHASARSRILGEIPSRILLGEHFRQRRGVVISLFAAAAVLLFGVMILHLFSPKLKDSALVKVSPGTILKRAEDGTDFRDSRLASGQEVQLVQGVSYLAFESGVTAVIDGPAVLKLTGRNELHLAAGHAWFQVPEQARGFRVTCPDLEVIDLGTEFGIDQREDRRPAVQVLKGTVKIRALNGARHSQYLQAGDGAVLAADGTWSHTASEEGKFRKALPERLPVLKMDFEGLNGDALVIGGDAVGVSGATAQLVNPEHASFVPGISGNALALHGAGAFVKTTWSGISGSAPRTVGLWCRVPAGCCVETAPPLAWWGDSVQGWNKKFKFALFRNSSNHAVIRASFGESIFDGTMNLADGNWHHLALVYRGNLTSSYPDISFYIDGHPEEKISLPPSFQPIATDIRSNSADGLTIGKYELPANGRNPYLNATIDELRIFAGALDDAAIRELATRK